MFLSHSRPPWFLVCGHFNYTTSAMTLSICPISFYNEPIYPVKSSLTRHISARVTPHVGHGNPNIALNGQPIPDSSYNNGTMINSATAKACFTNNRPPPERLIPPTLWTLPLPCSHRCCFRHLRSRHRIRAPATHQHGVPSVIYR